MITLDPLGRRAEISGLETKQTHQEDEATLPCSYDPNEVSVYADDTHILVGVRFHASIDCDARHPVWTLWSVK